MGSLRTWMNCHLQTVIKAWSPSFLGLRGVGRGGNVEMLIHLLLLPQAFALFSKQVTSFEAPVEGQLAFVGHRPLRFGSPIHFSLTPY